MAHTHPDTSGPGRALLAGLVLTLAFAGLEVAAGLWSGSLALVADAGHMLVDSTGLALAAGATAISRRPADLRRTYGYARVEVLIVPVHVLLMLGIAAFIAFEAISRIGGDAEIRGMPVLVAGIAGLAVNLAVFRLLRGHSHQNLNARGAMLEVAADALGSAGVILSAIILLATGWAGADVIIGLVIAALVVPRALVLLRQALSVLLESAPPGTDVAAIERDAREIRGVNALHDLHVWTLGSGFAALSAHVEVDSMAESAHAIAGLSIMLQERHGIAHVTLQPETHELHEAIACCRFPDSASDHAHAPALSGRN